MKRTCKALSKKYETARALRVSFEDLFQECYDYALPQRRVLLQCTWTSDDKILMKQQ